MNGFIEEVCTQGELMKEVLQYYMEEKTIDDVVNVFRQKGMKKVIMQTRITSRMPPASSPLSVFGNIFRIPFSSMLIRFPMRHTG